MKKIINEFKTFIERGNVVDLAVGVVMGSAFSKIVTSVVDDLLMPIIGIIIGGHDFSNLSIKVGESTIRYGSLINNVINFFIIAFCIFLLVKFINKLTSINKKKEDKKRRWKNLRRVMKYYYLKRFLANLRNLIENNLYIPVSLRSFRVFFNLSLKNKCFG